MPTISCTSIALAGWIVAARTSRYSRSSLVLPVTPDGLIRVPAFGATANTLPGRPDTFYIGGEPVLVLEPLPARYQPFAPMIPNVPVTPSTPFNPPRPLRDDAEAPDAASP